MLYNRGPRLPPLPLLFDLFMVSGKGYAIAITMPIEL